MTVILSDTTIVLILVNIMCVCPCSRFELQSPNANALTATSQGMLPEALIEYVAVIFADRKNGSNPSTIEKADEVCRLVAAKKTATRLEEIRASSSSTVVPLPMKSYCRKFLETLPSVHCWREKYKNADRDELHNKWKAVVADSSASTAAVLSSACDLAQIDLSCSLFSRAFATVNSALDRLPHTEKMDSASKSLFSTLWQLRGVELLFRRDDNGAIAAELKAVELDPSNLEAKLLLCILHLELVEIKQVRHAKMRSPSHSHSQPPHILAVF